MPIVHLTKRSIDDIDHPAKGQILVRDALLRGFGLRVNKASKVFFAEGQVSRRTCHVTIGLADVLAPEVARRRALKVLGMMAEGIDPNQVKRDEHAEGITVARAFEQFFQSKPHLAVVTVKGYARTRDLYIKDWSAKPLAQITRQMVLTRHRKITAQRGAVTANNAFRHFRSVYNFTAAKFDEFPPCPTIILTQAHAWHKERRRQSVVPAHLLPAWWQAVMREDETSRNILLVALFTGMRRGEVVGLGWDDVDLMSRTLTIPRTKNGDPLVLPLSSFLLDLLRGRRRLTGNSPWIFSSRSASGHVQETKKMTARVSAAIVHQFTIHDLRRTFITVAESLDIPHDALKRLLNHRADSDVSGGYIVINAERLREPVERVAERILELANAE